jgi:hypothetical protein
MHEKWIGCAILMCSCIISCGGQSAGACRGDNDCPGGACVVGQCRPLAGGDLAVSGARGDMSGTRAADLLLPVPDGWNIDALGGGNCAFNNDGVITRAELPVTVGIGALFAVNAPNTTVPVNNVAQNGVWDFSAPVSGEGKQFDQLLAPSGQWWAGDFTTATYGQRIDDGQQVYGVFRNDPDDLVMLGVVSDENGLEKTELTYATPIIVLKFPLMVGSTWTSESDVSGTADGVAFYAHEKYDFTVDVRGTTRTPAASFDTLRLRMTLTRTFGDATTQITYLHVAECYGTVARIRSQDGETSNNFTQASEYRRLAGQ